VQTTRLTADRLWSYRRILELEKLTHDCSIGRQSFQQPQQAASVEGQGISALRFGDPRVQALFAVVVIFSLQPQGFRNRELRRSTLDFLSLEIARTWWRGGGNESTLPWRMQLIADR